MKNEYLRFIIGFLGIIIIIGGGYFVWDKYFNEQTELNAQNTENYRKYFNKLVNEKSFFSKAIDSVKNLIAQVSNFFLDVSSTNNQFQPVGQISLNQKNENKINSKQPIIQHQTLNQKSLINKKNQPIEQPVQKWCSFNTNQSPSRQKIIINETAWMGTSYNVNNEWIELKNISNSTIDISAWQLLDKDERIKIIFPSNSKIPAGEFYLLERNENAVPNIKADILYTGNLKNSDEGLRFFDANCNLIDEVLANPNWPAGDNSSKHTMERKSNLSWQTSINTGGTPKTTNSQLTVIYSGNSGGETTSNQSTPIPLIPLKILINEIQIRGNKANNEFIELYNLTSNTISLANYSIQYLSDTTTSTNKIIKKKFKNNSQIIPYGFFLLVNSNTISSFC